MSNMDTYLKMQKVAGKVCSTLEKLNKKQKEIEQLARPLMGFSVFLEGYKKNHRCQAKYYQSIVDDQFEDLEAAIDRVEQYLKQ